MTIRFTLREILAERNISERQFAKEHNIREGTFYQICNNEIKRLPVEIIDRISNALNIEPGDWIKHEFFNVEKSKIPHLRTKNGKVIIDSKDPLQKKWFEEFKK